MEKNKVLVLVGRQLDAESLLIDKLEKICACFTANALESISDNSRGPQLQQLDLLLDQFNAEAAKTITARQSTMALVGQLEAHGHQNDVSVRRFVQNCEEPWRSQLEEKRVGIINRIYQLKIQLAGDSAAVFYSYDFYRRIINSVVGVAVQETEYSNAGKSVSKNSGKFYERAC